MNKANNSHPVRIILRDWSKAKKGNRPVIAEKKEVYHDQRRENNSSNQGL